MTTFGRKIHKTMRHFFNEVNSRKQTEEICVHEKEEQNNKKIKLVNGFEIEMKIETTHEKPHFHFEILSVLVFV